MRIDYSKRFLKHLQKTNTSLQLAFKERLKLFIADRHNPLLNNHSLQGKRAGYRSINVSGDWRAIYHNINNKIEWVEFVEIGTHRELYK